MNHFIPLSCWYLPLIFGETVKNSDSEEPVCCPFWLNPAGSLTTSSPASIASPAKLSSSAVWLVVLDSTEKKKHGTPDMMYVI